MASVSRGAGGGLRRRVAPTRARGDQSYASLRFHVGPGGTVPIPVCVDYSRPFAASDRAAWERQYQASVELRPPILGDSPAPWFPSAEEDDIDW